jgi:hypothetical protein
MLMHPGWNNPNPNEHQKMGEKKKTSGDFLIMLMHQATPMLTEDRVQECIDPQLGDQYPPAGAVKVSLNP